MGLDITGIGTAITAISKVADRFFPDPDKAQEFKLKLAEIESSKEMAELTAETELLKGQLEINKIEAASDSMFVKGWRPFLAWAIITIILVNAIAQLVMRIYGMPAMILIEPSDMSLIRDIILALIGFRTVEKFKK